MSGAEERELRTPSPGTACLVSLGVFLLVVGGCSGGGSPHRDRDLLRTFADLALLYETEKGANRLPDSLYHVRVLQFFRTRGISEQDFRSRIAVVRSDAAEWKAFLQEASLMIDSLRAVRPAATPKAPSEPGAFSRHQGGSF